MIALPLQLGNVNIAVRDMERMGESYPGVRWAYGVATGRAPHGTCDKVVNEYLLQPRAEAIRGLFRRCDELAEAVRAVGEPWVVTHGQMHEANVVRTTDDRMLIVDWDCVALAPRERDLGTWGSNLDPKTDTDWATYSAAGHPRDLDSTAIELYRLIGLLWGICADTALFRSPHVDSGDTRHEWGNLRVAMSQVDEWPS